MPPNRGERVITEIEIEGFKSLEKVRLKLGEFNLFIGVNASGKSNFLDALRVFQGIGNGFLIEEIFQGKPKSSTSEVWEGIRGGIARAKYMRQASEAGKEPIAFRVQMRAPRGTHEFRYAIEVSAEYGTVEAESLIIDSRPVFDVSAATGNWSDLWLLRENGQRGRPALPVNHVLLPLESGEEEELAACVKMLANMQNLSLVPEVLRDYGQPLLVNRIGDAGENFPSLVKSIISSEPSRSAYVSWLRQLLSSEAEDIEILSGAVGEPLFALRRGRLVFPAHILSDGTLRFAAFAAAFFQPDMPDTIKIEEIENGIHPGRLRLLVELLKSQSHVDGPQVFATTHSPVILAWLDESDYETTFFCKRDEETGASIIKPLSEIPRLVELVKSASLGELFTEGWMEGAF